jgi:signal transduction histidine kinase
MHREPAKRAVRLHTTTIPATRLAGFAIVCVLIPLHNAALFGDPRWSSLGTFALAASLYCLGSWLILKAFFARSRRVPLGDLFLAADILVLLLAVDLSGGPQSWLFLLMAGRCVDQLAGGYRRTVWFNHLIVGAYAIYLLFVARHGDAPWTSYVVKLALLYAFNWYCSITAQTVDSVRARARRSEVAKRTEAEITATVAHEIRTSTEGISVLTELLTKTPLDARQQHYVRGLAEHIRHVLDKIPLLAASATEAGPVAVQETLFPLRPLIEEVASLMRPLAEIKGLDFRVEIGTHAPFSVTGDAVKIRQVLLSVIHNAIRFTECGSVELQCSRLWPGHVVLQVQDSGPGIPAHVQRRVSAGFVRADGTPWHRYHGDHVGLSIAQRLIELMGGRLELTSEPSRGTTVCVVLPIQGSKSFFVARPIPPDGASGTEHGSKLARSQS